MDGVPKFGFSAHGKRYLADLTDFDGVEASLFRKAVGFSTIGAFQALGQGTIDPLELVAGLKWLIDRRDDKDLQYEDVLRGLNYENIDLEDDEEQEPINPPVDGGSSVPSYPPSPPSLASTPGS